MNQGEPESTKHGLIESYKAVYAAVQNPSEGAGSDLNSLVEKLGSLILSLEDQDFSTVSLQATAGSVAMDHSSQIRVVPEAQALPDENHPAEAAILEAKQRRIEMEAVFNSMTDGVALFDANGGLIRINPVGMAYHGFDPQQMDFSEVYARMQILYPDGSRVPLEELPSRRALRGEVVRNLNLRMVNLVGQVFDLSTSATPFYEGEHTSGAIVIWHDLTDRDCLRLELEAEQACLKAIIEHAPEGILVMNEENRIVMMNPEAERLLCGMIRLGQQVSEISQNQFLFPDGSAWNPVNFPFTQAKTGADKIKNREMILNLPHGQRCSLLISAGPILSLSGEHRGAIVIFQDLAERKQAQKESRRHQAEIEVHHRLIEQREQERVKIAHYLHEQPLQELIALTYIISKAESQTEDEKLLATLKTAETTLRSEIVELRKFCNDLRSPVLTNFGLQIAIRSYIEDLMEKHPGIVFHMDLDKDRKRIPETRRLALYHIFQEAITNGIKHSHAEHMEISLRMGPSNVTMTLSDDGCGFDTLQIGRDLAGKDCMGLISIQERAEAIGGKLQIISRSGEGTQVIVSVPIG